MSLKQAKEKIFKSLVIFLIMAICFYFLEIFLFKYFILDLITSYLEYFIGNGFYEIVEPIAVNLLSSFSNLNIFIDSFICAIFDLYFSYIPKSGNKNKIIVVRSLVIISISYIILSLVLMILSGKGLVSLNIYQEACFTARPLYAYLFFIFICFYDKYKQKFYERKLREIDYETYSLSNKAARRYSLAICIALVILTEFEYLLSLFINQKGISVTNSLYLLLAIPLILVLDCRKNPKNKWTLHISYVWLVFLYIIAVIMLLGILLLVAEKYGLF